MRKVSIRLVETSAATTFKCPSCKKQTKVGECPHCGKYTSAFDTKKKRGGGGRTSSTSDA